MNEFGLSWQDPLDVFTQETLRPGIFMKGGGGGGSSGKVDYPEYMKNMHGSWLTDLDTLITGTASPFLGGTVWDPDLTLADQEAAVASFSTAVAGLNYLTDWDAAITAAQSKWDSVIDDTIIDAEVQAFGDLVQEDITDNVLPAFQSGMRDVNAVMTSAFVMGESKIWSGKTKEMVKHGTSIKLQANQDKYKLIQESTKNMLEQYKMSMEMENVVASLYVEMYRIKIVAKKEQCESQFELDEKDARWALDMYQYGVDMLGGIGGGTVGAGAKPSKTQSALGGALSGAATGAMVGSAVPGIGTAIGAGIGGVMGLAGGLL